MRAGEAYVDVGTLHGYREANQLLDDRGGETSAAAASFPNP
jgi:hypothetical protein